MARRIYFEQHIQPLIRELDREQMLTIRPGLDLWDPVVVKNNAVVIESLLKNADPGSIMPPMLYGGPWPQEWISLFQKWMNDGFHSLELGTATLYEAMRFPDFVLITATVTKSDPKYSVWLNRYFGPPKTGGLPDLVLYQELRDIVPPLITDEGLGIFRIPAGVTSLRILDSAGLQTVPISAAAPARLSPLLAKRIVK